MSTVQVQHEWVYDIERVDHEDRGDGHEDSFPWIRISNKSHDELDNIIKVGRKGGKEKKLDAFALEAFPHGTYTEVKANQADEGVKYEEGAEYNGFCGDVDGGVLGVRVEYFQACDDEVESLDEVEEGVGPEEADADFNSYYQRESY